MSLDERLAAQIAAQGPMTVAQYMTACLHDPDFGYYATRPALGADGDFLTAPLVSQMFGELIGLWCVETWRRLGEPAPFRLVEIGPGDGTLIGDLLRAVRGAPGFLEAADLWLVETSAPLAAAQRRRLSGQAANWAVSLDQVPAGAPILLLANELLDCLPTRQFVRVGEAWIERMVGLDASGGLAFGLAEQATPARDAPILELSAAQEAMGELVGARIAADGGAALLIDYGRHEPGFGDTLQALKSHEKVDPLACPGEADLTVHADFPLVLRAAGAAGARTTPAIAQGIFLLRLGIGARAQALQAARPDRAEVIERQFERLVSPEQMGELFRVCCIHAAGLAPPGFEEGE